MSYGYAAPCPGDDLPYVSREEQTARNLAQIREQQVREAEALASRAAAAGRLPHEQANEEWAEAQASLVAKAKAKAAREAALRLENQAKGLVPGGKFSHEAAVMWPQQGIPGAKFPCAAEAICCAQRAIALARHWQDRGRGLDGLLFHGEEEGETYVLVYFASTNRLAVCRA